MDHSLLEVHPSPYLGYLVLLAIGGIGFGAARRWPRSLWLTLPLLAWLVSGEVLGLLGSLSAPPSAEYAPFVYRRVLFFAATCLGAFGLPLLGAGRSRSRASRFAG